jgi:hypothetical protein
MPVVIDRPETCISIHVVRMNAIAAASIRKERLERKGGRGEDDGSTDAEHDLFLACYDRNVATVIVWGLLHLLCPEVTFRKDALAALYALTETLRADQTLSCNSSSKGRIVGLDALTGESSVGGSQSSLSVLPKAGVHAGER